MNNNLINNSIKKQDFRSMTDTVFVVTQLCSTFCHSMDCSPPGSSVHGILQARILEWVAMPFSRGCLDPGIKPRSPTLQADSSPSEPPGNDTNDRHCLVLKAGVYLIETQLFIST